MDAETIVITGDFTTVNGQPRSRIAKLTTTGSGVEERTLVREVLSHISKSASGVDYIASGAPSVMPVAVAFTDRRPLIDWIDDITSNTDMIYDLDSEVGSLVLTQRFGGGDNPEQFRIYAAGLVPDSDGEVINRQRSTPPEAGYVVDYFDETSSNTDQKDQAVGSVRTLANVAPKSISSFVTRKTDAQYLADRDARDVYGSSEYSMTVVGLGLGLKNGQVGYLYTDRTNGYDAEIADVNELKDAGNTEVTINLYDIKRSANDDL